MYGADWPVSELTHRYPEWVEILDWITAAAPIRNGGSCSADNAIAFYRLDRPAR